MKHYKKILKTITQCWWNAQIKYAILRNILNTNEKVQIHKRYISSSCLLALKYASMFENNILVSCSLLYIILLHFYSMLYLLHIHFYLNPKVMARNALKKLKNIRKNQGRYMLFLKKIYLSKIISWVFDIFNWSD